MSKHIKTNQKFAGNKYGIIRKHSKIDRYYGVQRDNGEVICRDYFLSMNGARLAAMLVDLGYTEEMLNTVNCDDIAATAKHNRVSKGLSIAESLKIEAEKIRSEK